MRRYLGHSLLDSQVGGVSGIRRENTSIGPSNPFAAIGLAAIQSRPLPAVRSRTTSLPAPGSPPQRLPNGETSWTAVPKKSPLRSTGSPALSPIRTPTPALDNVATISRGCLCRFGRRNESGHDPVAGVLDHRACMGAQRLLYACVVGLHNPLCGIISDALRHRRRRNQVGEHDRPERPQGFGGLLMQELKDELIHLYPIARLHQLCTRDQA